MNLLLGQMFVCLIIKPDFFILGRVFLQSFVAGLVLDAFSEMFIKSFTAVLVMHLIITLIQLIRPVQLNILQFKLEKT